MGWGRAACADGLQVADPDGCHDVGNLAPERPDLLVPHEGEAARRRGGLQPDLRGTEGEPPGRLAQRPVLGKGALAMRCKVMPLRQRISALDPEVTGNRPKERMQRFPGAVKETA